ncbi:MAG: macrolide ABC transporter ATP-binding protein [Deltaproteobacteria bacterium]|nr:MAG: macrolide ABC transporter ATP-binding protein [Pseudomonadota bacterium]PIE65956.1 MAG: macrolide ABC transporter ATP-binding protein [Deltaproteobacteria bacterium]
MSSLVHVRELYKDYGRRTTVLRGVDLAVEAGELVAVVGESGCGKTTLLNVIGGLDRRFRGSVTVCGQALERLSDGQLSALRGSEIGFVFQHFALLEHLSVAENVALPGLFAKTAREPSRVERCLEEVGLVERATALARHLSGGQKQRVAIARALYNKPRLLLCDEPTGNLDSVTGRQIIELFERLNRELELTLVLVTHEPRVSQRASRVVQMTDGQLAGEGD